VVQGGGDLLDGLKEGTVSLEKLDPKALPEEMRGLDKAGRKAYLAQKEGERARIQTRIAELSRRRQTFLEADAKKRAATGQADSFDGKVGEAIRAQGARKGIRYEKTGK
jgi:hypothetical protein